MLINSMVFNSEVWYRLTKSQIEQMEEVDRLYLRRALNVAVAVPQESLFLKLGIMPLRYIIMG